VTTFLERDTRKLVSLSIQTVCIGNLDGCVSASAGVLLPENTVASIFISALSVSVAITLILEIYTPYKGLIHISGAPLRAALVHLGQ